MYKFFLKIFILCKYIIINFDIQAHERSQHQFHPPHERSQHQFHPPQVHLLYFCASIHCLVLSQFLQALKYFSIFHFLSTDFQVHAIKIGKWCNDILCRFSRRELPQKEGVDFSFSNQICQKTNNIFIILPWTWLLLTQDIVEYGEEW